MRDSLRVIKVDLNVDLARVKADDVPREVKVDTFRLWVPWTQLQLESLDDEVPFWIKLKIVEYIVVAII